MYALIYDIFGDADVKAMKLRCLRVSGYVCRWRYVKKFADTADPRVENEIQVYLIKKALFNEGIIISLWERLKQK